MSEMSGSVNNPVLDVLDDGETKPAPGTLRLVQAFVNTRDLYHDIEHLPSVESLQAWMVNAGLMDGEADVSDLSRVSEEDLEITVQLREALRELLDSSGSSDSNNSVSHAKDTPQHIEDLNQLADSLPVKVSFGDPGDGGRVQVARPASSVRGALGILLGFVLYAEASGSWSRLRACANPGCKWVFYDSSKNRVGSWCRMSSCGNQAKSRAHRERTRASGTGSR